MIEVSGRRRATNGKRRIPASRLSRNAKRFLRKLSSFLCVLRSRNEERKVKMHINIHPALRLKIKVRRVDGHERNISLRCYVTGGRGGRLSHAQQTIRSSSAGVHVERRPSQKRAKCAHPRQSSWSNNNFLSLTGALSSCCLIKASSLLWKSD